MKMLTFPEFEQLVMKRVHRAADILNCSVDQVFATLPTIKFDLNSVLELKVQSYDENQLGAIQTIPLNSKGTDGSPLDVHSSFPPRQANGTDTPGPGQDGSVVISGIEPQLGHETSATTLKCPICMENSSKDSISPLPCHHGQFCRECAGQNFTYHMKKTGNSCLGVPCVQHRPMGCTEVFPYDTVKKVLSGKAIARHYELFVRRFCRHMPDMQRCAKDSCKTVIQNRTQSPSSHYYICNSKFCRECGLENHGKIPCSWLQEWTDLELNDSGNQSWLKAHTKKCPKCGTHVEKNDGCNHMTCRLYRAHWCWHCKTECWNSQNGDYFKCTGPSKAEKTDLKEEKEAEIERQKREMYDQHYHQYLNYRSQCRIMLEEKKTVVNTVKNLVLMYICCELEFVPQQS